MGGVILYKHNPPYLSSTPVVLMLAMWKLCHRAVLIWKRKWLIILEIISQLIYLWRCRANNFHIVIAVGRDTSINNIIRVVFPKQVYYNLQHLTNGKDKTLEGNLVVHISGLIMKSGSCVRSHLIGQRKGNFMAKKGEGRQFYCLTMIFLSLLLIILGT